MTTIQEIALSVGLLFLVGYPILMRVLARLIQPSRIIMVDIGKELLSSPHLSERHKRLVNSMLDDAYSPMFMLTVALVMPVFAIVILLKLRDPLPQIEDAQTKQVFDEFSRRYVASTAVANPIFTLVAAVEMAVLTLVLFPLGQLWRAQVVQFGTIEAADETLQVVGRVLHRRAA